MSKTLKEFTAEEVKFFDGGVAAGKLKKQLAAASGDAAAKLKAEIAKYSDKCYIILHGKVYDVTTFLAKHPGGPESILQVGGRDCTVEFEDIFHSQTAREQVQEYLVGSLKGYEGADDAIFKGASGSSGSGSLGPLLIPAIIAVLAVVYYFTM
jgi:cytochrome b involved in lipid metabolism